MAQTKAQREERAYAIERLKEIIQPGDTVYTILRHVSSSGMMRHISAVVIKDGEHYAITRLVALATDSKMVYAGTDAIKVAGAGMDMGFALIYDLSYRLSPDGFDCIGNGQDNLIPSQRRRCPSNDHSNIWTPEALETCQPGACTQFFGDCQNRECVPWHHKDGGYGLRQVWL